MAPRKNDIVYSTNSHQFGRVLYVYDAPYSHLVRVLARSVRLPTGKQPVIHYIESTWFIDQTVSREDTSEFGWPTLEGRK